MEDPSGTAEEEDGGTVPLFDNSERGLTDPAEHGEEGKDPEEDPESDGESEDGLDLFGDDEDEEGDLDDEEDAAEEDEAEAEGDSEEERQAAKPRGHEKLTRRVQKLARARREAEGKAQQLGNELESTKGQLSSWQQLYPGERGLENAEFDRRFMDNLIQHKRDPIVQQAIRHLTGQGAGEQSPERTPERKAPEPDPSAKRALELAERSAMRAAEGEITGVLTKAGIHAEFHKTLSKAALAHLDLASADEESVADAVRKAIRESGFSRELLRGAKRKSGPPTGRGRGAARVSASREQELEGAGAKPDKGSDKPKTHTERYARANRRLSEMLNAR